jgi:hypothetical protein
MRRRLAAHPRPADNLAMKVRRFMWNALAVWGAASAIAVLALVGVFAYGQIPKTDTATRNDVRFMLNWPGLGEDRLEGVVHSYVSNSGPLGDHFYAYAVRLRSLTEADLAAPVRNEPAGWIRGDRVDVLLRNAVEFAAVHGEAPWLPTAEQLLTAEYYVWVWRIEVRGNNRVAAADVMFARPSDRMMFYASFQV